MLDPSLLPLTRDRARLRRLRQSDADAFAAGASDPLVRRFGHLPEPDYTPQTVAKMIEEQVEPGLRRGDLAVLAIAEAVTDTFAGSLVLFDVREVTAEVGFWIHPQHRGAGLAKDALRLAERFARNSGLRELAARTVTDNAASQRVLMTAGFRETARTPDVTPSGERVELLHFRRSIT